MTEISAFAGFVDLASSALGGLALATSDDFFAGKDNLLAPAPAAFDPDAYTDRGKLMDGWESRRKRVPGHDWCTIRLGAPGRLVGADIDTSFFLGNHPPFASLDAANADDAAVLNGEVDWVRVISAAPLKRGSHNLVPIQVPGTFTHVRLNIYPDGGVARLRVYGVPAPVVGDSVGAAGIDLIALAVGGRPLACSDMFFSPMTNLLLPGRSPYMGNGWETRRSRPPGRDWWIGALGVPGVVDAVHLDTGHFKGNYPDRAQVHGLWWPDAPPQALIDHPDWTPITAETRLAADTEHALPAIHPGPWTHVRLTVIPDGGVARMRVIGRPAAPPDGDPLLQRVNAASADAFARCCGSRRWASAMVAGRPYTSRTHLFGHAEQVWWHLEDRDWLEAFGHHPRIGAAPATLRVRFGDTAQWAAEEQAGTAGTDDATLEALAEGNRAYEQRFGHVFLICATGRSAAEMSAALRERLGNDPAAELRIAAGEQVKITRLRLEKFPLDRSGPELEGVP
ncbi:MAG: allantoicase [Myxococcota bacterium]